MLWEEHETWDVIDRDVFLSMILQRKSDGYHMSIIVTSTYPSNSCHLAVSAGGFGWQLEGVVLTNPSDQHSLALELSEVLERMKVQLTSRFSMRGKICPIPTMTALLRRESKDIIEFVE